MTTADQCAECAALRMMTDDLAAHNGEILVELQRAKEELAHISNECERLRNVNRALLETKPVPLCYCGGGKHG